MPNPYPKHAVCTSLSSPCSLMADTVSELFFHWELQLGTYSGFCLFVFPPGYVALWDSKSPHRPASERFSCCLETSPSWLPPQDGSPSLILLSLSLSFIFCPNSFWREWGVFPGAQCPLPSFRRHVLWRLLSIQIIFWWICEGESGLPVLFLFHLRTAFHPVSQSLRKKN